MGPNAVPEQVVAGGSLRVHRCGFPVFSPRPIICTLEELNLVNLVPENGDEMMWPPLPHLRTLVVRFVRARPSSTQTPGLTGQALSGLIISTSSALNSLHFVPDRDFCTTEFAWPQYECMTSLSIVETISESIVVPLLTQVTPTLQHLEITGGGSYGGFPEHDRVRVLRSLLLIASTLKSLPIRVEVSKEFGSLLERMTSIHTIEFRIGVTAFRGADH